MLHAKLYANARSTSKNITTLKITKITQKNEMLTSCYMLSYILMLEIQTITQQYQK